MNTKKYHSPTNLGNNYIIPPKKALLTFPSVNQGSKAGGGVLSIVSL